MNDRPPAPPLVAQAAQAAHTFVAACARGLAATAFTDATRAPRRVPEPTTA